MTRGVFVLGPSMWRSARQARGRRSSPLHARRAIVRALRAVGAHASIMEDEATDACETWQDKFYRLLEQRAVTHVLVY